MTDRLPNEPQQREPTAIKASRRRELATRALDGYENGPDASVRASNAAWMRVDTAEVILLVEGVSDQIVVETLAARRGIDVHGERVVVVPAGGAHALPTCAHKLAALSDDVEVLGLCDVGEAALVANVAADIRFFICDEDLEDEMIRAVGIERAERLFDTQGDLRAFRTLQKQQVWAGRPVDAQMRRFLGSGAKRKSRYARLFSEIIEPHEFPEPLDGLLSAI